MPVRVSSLRKPPLYINCLCVRRDRLVVSVVPFYAGEGRGRAAGEGRRRVGILKKVGMVQAASSA